MPVYTYTALDRAGKEVSGALFRRTVTTKSKTELLIFMTPHVAEEAVLLQEMSKDEQDGTVILRGAIGPGAFDRHLEGMQRGATPESPAEEN